MAKQRSAKSAETRERILSGALALFAEKGYTQTTMREIAAEAGCSLGLAYRYFKSKDAMVLAQYERMVMELTAEVAALPSAPLAQRWGLAIRGELARLQANRGALMGLTTAGLMPGSATQVLGRDAVPLRLRMLALFGELATNAIDAPRREVVEALPTLFYALHLVLVLFWLQDSSPGQRVTYQLIDIGEELLGRLRLILRLPWAAGGLTKLSAVLSPILGAPVEEAEGTIGESKSITVEET